MAVRGPHTPWAMMLSTLEWKTTEEMGFVFYWVFKFFLMSEKNL